MGWGISENFSDNPDMRYKFRGYIPYHLPKPAKLLLGIEAHKLFAGFEVDSDFKDGADEVKIYFGVNFSMNSFVKSLGLTK